VLAFAAGLLGDMYAGVPHTRPDAVMRVTSSSDLTRPKSATLRAEGVEEKCCLV